jgi:hypothetical protein
MSARSRMTQRALIERGTPGADDGYGNPGPTTWDTHIEALPCWLYEATERESVSEETTAVVTALKMMVPASADVTEQDRINGVKNRLGQVIEAGFLHIETVLWKRTHKELALSRVSS